MTRKRAGANRLSKDQETIRMVNECLLEGDLKELRRISAVRGLVNSPLRRKVWPLLLGLDPQTCRPLEPDEYKHLISNSRNHKDSNVINVDVARCLHQTNSYVGDHNREECRRSLIQLLNAVVDGENVFYYQGLHELASVLLLEVGEGIAYHTLRHLVVTHLRDNTRQNIDATLEALNILSPLLEAVDPEVSAHMRALELPPFFAISWMLTWFAHDIKRMTALTRLYDLFLACHPLMPLYLGTVAMLRVRKQILAAESMPELHTLLVNLDILSLGISIDELVKDAVTLYNEQPAKQLRRAVRGAIRHSAAVEAQLVDNAWWVPEKVSPGGTLTTAALDWLLRLPAVINRGKLTLRIVTVTSTSALFATAALVLAFTRLSQPEP